MKVTLVAFVVAALLVADLRYNRLDGSRAVLDTLLAPVFWVAGIPGAIGAWQDTHIRSRQTLLEDNSHLRRENLVLKVDDVPKLITSRGL